MPPSIGLPGAPPEPGVVRGVTNRESGSAVEGTNNITLALGLLGGTDTVFKQHAGVFGQSDQVGVFGHSYPGTGVLGSGNLGVRGETGNGEAAVKGQSFGTGLAGSFVGNVKISGDLTHDGGDLTCAGNVKVAQTVTAFDVSLNGGDCAEEFDVAGVERIAAGTVVVLGDQGSIEPSSSAYDKRVAGVVSGAGDYKPGITLDKRPSANRIPIGLIGKLYCWVDADYSPVKVGDLLTTSPTSGHAMKASDPVRSFGSVIGKALRPLDTGRGLIPILVALQ